MKGIIKIFPDPFAFVMAFDEKGHPNKNWLVNRSPQPNIAWKDADYHWDKVLAFGLKNTILSYQVSKERQYDKLVALTGITNIENGHVIAKSLWQYSLPSSVTQTVATGLTQAEGMADGGYVLLLKNDNNQEQDSYTMVRLLADGQTLWQQDSEISRLPKGFSDFGKKFFVLPDQKIVIYNYAVYNGKQGSQLICLDQNGQEATNQFFPGIYWDHWMIEFKPILGGKGFIFPYYDKMTSTSGGNVSSEYLELKDGSEEKTDFIHVQSFDANCQPGVSQRLMIPTHKFG